MPVQPPDDTAEVRLFADGACSGNPGPGGWAFILRHVATGKEKEAFGAERQTTNNRMETDRRHPRPGGAQTTHFSRAR